MDRPAARTALAVFFVAVPAALAAVWCSRTAPPPAPCHDWPTPGLAAAQERWLAGGSWLIGAAGVIVCAGIVLAGGRRRIVTAAAAYVLATALVHGAFVLYGLPAAIAFFGVVWGAMLVFIGPAPADVTAAVVLLACAGLTVGAARDEWRNGNFPDPLLALGWASLLLGVGGVALAVALPLTAGPCLN